MKANANYLPELTGLRGWAALWVAVFHMQYNFGFSYGFFELFFTPRYIQKAYLAVDIFFILSGFVMAHTTANWKGDNFFEFWKFFLRKRFARIYPMHIFSLGLAFTFFFLTDQLKGEWIKSLFANIGMVHAWGRTFYPDYNFASWSISTEWGAYLVFPFLLLATRKIANHWLKSLSLIVIMLWGLSMFSIYFKEGKLDLTTDLGLVRCFFEFVTGLCLYQLHRQIRETKAETLDLSFILSLCGFAAFFTFAIADYWLLLPTTILIFCLIRRANVSRPVFGNKVSHFLGNISYSVYMLHVPVGLTFIRFWTQWFGKGQSTMMGATCFVLAVALIVLCATLAYNYIEVPLRNWMAPKDLESKKESRLKQSA